MAATEPTVTAAGSTAPSAPRRPTARLGGGRTGARARVSTTSRTRASRSRAARWCSAWRPTPPTPGRRTGPATRRAGTSRSSAISDSLFAVTDEGETYPLLVESVDHNADYTEWTLHIREGITFHDGTPLDGAAVKFNIDANRAAPLTAGALTPIDTVTASGQDVVITIKGGPWVALPNYLTYGVDRVHAVADVAGEPARRPAAHRGWPGLRRRGRGDAGRRRPGEAGRARGVRVRVVHAGQRQRLPRRAQRGLLARPERHHR